MRNLPDVVLGLRKEMAVNALAYDLFALLSIGFGLMVGAALWKAQKKAIKRDVAQAFRLGRRSE